MMTSSFTYVTYIRTTPERLWSALTNPEFMTQHWFGMHIRTDWKPGTPWQLLFTDGRVADGGQIVEAVPPKRLVMSWLNEWDPECHAEGPARLTMTLEEASGAVKLTILHEIDRSESKLIKAVSGGWPRILCNLKPLLETGEVTFREPVAAEAR